MINEGKRPMKTDDRVELTMGHGGKLFIRPDAVDAVWQDGSNPIMSLMRMWRMTMSIKGTPDDVMDLLRGKGRGMTIDKKMTPDATDLSIATIRGWRVTHSGFWRAPDDHESTPGQDRYPFRWRDEPSEALELLCWWARNSESSNGMPPAVEACALMEDVMGTIDDADLTPSGIALAIRDAIAEAEGIR